MEIKNLAEVLAGLNLTEKKVNDAARYAIGMAAASVERQASAASSHTAMPPRRWRESPSSTDSRRPRQRSRERRSRDPSW